MRRLLLALVLGVVPVFAVGGVAHADPPGNNGTVKIQEPGGKEVPDNDPHVGCVFIIEFRGFDEGDLEATWALRAHPPSGQGTLVESGSLDIGEDAAGGANDLDGTVTITLTEEELAGLTRHPQQGYHLKLTVHAEGSQGADTKFKVFWVEACPSGSELVEPSGNLTSGTGADATVTENSAATSASSLPFAIIALASGLIALALWQPLRTRMIRGREQ